MTFYSFFRGMVESFHPFASRAARHHGVLLDRYSAKNLAYICGFDRALNGFVADCEFNAHLLIGKEGIMTVDRYSGEVMDIRDHDTEWVEIDPDDRGDEFRVQFRDDDVFACLTCDDQLMYSAGAIDDESKDLAAKIARDYGFEVNFPETGALNEALAAKTRDASDPSPEVLRRMEESIRYHQD